MSLFLRRGHSDTSGRHSPGRRRGGDEPAGRQERALPGRDQGGRQAAQPHPEALARHQRVISNKMTLCGANVTQ